MKEDKPKRSVADILREIEEKKGRPIPNKHVVVGIKKNNKSIVEKKNIECVDRKTIGVLIIIILFILICYFIYRGVYP